MTRDERDPQTARPQRRRTTRLLKLPMSAVLCTMQPAVDKPVITRPPESYGLAPSWDFSYGTCHSSGGEGGCADPVNIQENDSCWDNLGQFSRNGRRRLHRVRGVPSSASVDSADGFAELVLYTRSTTVTLDAPDLHKATEIALALRGANTRYTTRSELPAPSYRTLEGKTKCHNLQHSPAIRPSTSRKPRSRMANGGEWLIADELGALGSSLPLLPPAGRSQKRRPLAR